MESAAATAPPGVPVVLADAVTAAGYRLGGAHVVVPTPASVLQSIDQAMEHAPLVLITAQCAGWLPQDRLRALMASISPPVLVVPDAQGLSPMPDLAAWVRTQLGVLS